MTEGGWSEWFTHDGTCNPVPIGTFVEMHGEHSGVTSIYVGPNRDFMSWYICNHGAYCYDKTGRLIRSATVRDYRYMRPKALEDLIEIARNLDVLAERVLT